MAEARKPRLEIVEEETPIEKPSAFNLNKFKSTQAASIANVETLQTGLPHPQYRGSERLRSLASRRRELLVAELCFVNVPIKGQKRDTLHLIDEDLAMQYLPSGKIMRFRLALATKPYDVFFLCHIPTQNEDNPWNASNLAGLRAGARRRGCRLPAAKEEGVDGYKIDLARDADAFPDPKWPTQSLDELIETTFAGRMIDREDHPALLRLIGAKQSVS